MNRLQEDTRERLCLKAGALHVRDHYSDHHVELTAPNGALWHVNEDGVPKQQPIGDWSVRWDA